MKTTLLAIKRLRGTIYYMDAGDALPMHTHDEATTHITIVASGSVRIWGTWGEVTEHAPSVRNFVAGQPHEIVALEPTMLVAILTD
jgi:quercetin dioxygenase-like cupin family protein